MLTSSKRVPAIAFGQYGLLVMVCGAQVEGARSQGFQRRLGVLAEKERGLNREGGGEQFGLKGRPPRITTIKSKTCELPSQS